MDKRRLITVMVVCVELVVIAFLANKYFQRDKVLSLPEEHLNSSNYSRYNFTQEDIQRYYPKVEKRPKHRIRFKRKSDIPGLMFELKSNFSQLFDGGPVRIPVSRVETNSAGFRDREYAVEKPNNTYRIIALGDSITFGWGVNNFEVWTEVLERKLNEIEGEKRYQVLNFGVSAYDTRQEILLFKHKARKYGADLVLHQFYQNDNLNSRRLRELKEKFIHRLRSSTNLSHQKTYLVARNKAVHVELAQKRNMPIEKSMEMVVNSLSSLNNITKRDGTEVVLFSFYAHRRQEKLLKNLTNRFGWPYLNLHRKMRKNYNMRELFLPRDPHSNAKGHRIMASILLDFLQAQNILPAE